jgi:hypothetical protein
MFFLRSLAQKKLFTVPGVTCGINL